MEKGFGIQIDSLADVVSFGVLPACIGAAMLWRSELFSGLFDANPKAWYILAIKGVLFGILILYILAAMIRLAYFNVDEEQRSRTEGGTRKFYTGLPVTSAALVFPNVLMLDYVVSYFAKKRIDLTPLYFVVAIIVGFLFLSKLKIKKPGMRGILILVGIGAVEFALMAVLYIIFKHRLV
jgi:CDP-diacylglycerol--serine O-phosphatidyltransferase